jgi:uncharacterized protein (TIGR02246 family)
MIFPLTLLVFVACQPTEQQVTTTGPDVEAITTWLGQVTAAVSAGNPEGVLALYADDAVFSPPDAPSITLEELGSMYGVMFGESTFQFTAQVLDVVVSGDLAVLRASYEETVTPKGEGEPEDRDGTWLVVLRKQTDGSWKLWRDMWSVIAPPAPPKM